MTKKTKKQKTKRKKKKHNKYPTVLNLQKSPCIHTHVNVYLISSKRQKYRVKPSGVT